VVNNLEITSTSEVVEVPPIAKRGNQMSREKMFNTEIPVTDKLYSNQTPCDLKQTADSNTTHSAETTHPSECLNHIKSESTAIVCSVTDTGEFLHWLELMTSSAMLILCMVRNKESACFTNNPCRKFEHISSKQTANFRIVDKNIFTRQVPLRTLQWQKKMFKKRLLLPDRHQMNSSLVRCWLWGRCHFPFWFWMSVANISWTLFVSTAPLRKFHLSTMLKMLFLVVTKPILRWPILTASPLITLLLKWRRTPLKGTTWSRALGKLLLVSVWQVCLCSLFTCVLILQQLAYS